MFKSDILGRPPMRRAVEKEEIPDADWRVDVTIPKRWKKRDQAKPSEASQMGGRWSNHVSYAKEIEDWDRILDIEDRIMRSTEDATPKTCAQIAEETGYDGKRIGSILRGMVEAGRLEHSAKDVIKGHSLWMGVRQAKQIRRDLVQLMRDGRWRTMEDLKNRTEWADDQILYALRSMEKRIEIAFVQRDTMWRMVL